MFDFEIAFLLHEARLREAEQERFYNQVSQRGPSFGERVLVRIADLLIAIGNWLQETSVVPTQAACTVNDLELKRAR